MTTANATVTGEIVAIEPSRDSDDRATQYITIAVDVTAPDAGATTITTTEAVCA